MTMPSSPQEVVLASSPDGPIVAYDASTGTPLANFNSSRSPRRGITRAGKSFIAVSHICPVTASGSIHIYNWWTSSAFQCLTVPEPVAPLTATPDGFYLFAGGLSGYIHILSLPSGDVLNSLPAHKKPVSCLKLSADGSLLISGGDDGTIVVMPIFQLVQAKPRENATEHILHQFLAHTDSVTSIYSGMGISSTKIVSCSLDARCKFWSLLSGTILHTVVFPCAIFSVVLEPSEIEFFAAGSDGLVYKGSLRHNNKHRRGTDYDLIPQISNDLVYKRSLRHKNKHLTGTSFELIPWSPKHEAAVVSIVIVNEGKHLISAAEDGSIWVWEVKKGQVIMALENEMGSISDLVMATERAHGKEQCVRTDRHGREIKISERFRLPIKMLGLSIKETVDMQGELAAAGSDVRRAIEMLESAIAVYEKMLELILKEAEASYNQREETQ
ncbi:protein ROOT INITIATION DEFECTIVE 3-like [Cucumis melo var. makuwa]|uniref:Protein ROOT INITIATION DEFECTIVE 3-like n=2 Tax=Cucumis melo TaxID=3656 RepID=A0A5A7UZU9_CUCMM|nr:protein ROOT INITIATION DEFECTIVE 3-like [Cucumis melo]KAA0059059.1 protein ROOT INITIATION DEFECTIVE 3-like [Cucumis melo var. makuwa]